jgi:excisionase family DNA binding protein
MTTARGSEDGMDMMTATLADRVSPIVPGANFMSEWITATEAAPYLRVDERTILLWARQGKVIGHILSGTQRITWRFRRYELDATMHLPSVALTKGRIQ